ncbi:hypothetical protein [Nioella nitratireducens]|uniref:hypothetical protein n=1 Tax=Nioella nitratireducens TaxID=1287720 RepID=UPI0011BA5A4E|nr:hypothetical protein [Nioella nitratireducens]
MAGLSLSGTSAMAQLYNPCPYTNDGDCDEPNGLGYCDWGTDTADCSNPNSNFGAGASGGNSGGYSSGGGLYNPCPYTNDGDCDEPNGLGYCDWGTDTNDCSNPNSNYGTGSGYSSNSGATTGGSTTTEGSPSTYAPWMRITNDQRQFAAQPGGAMPLVVNNGRNFEAGSYVIYYGVTDGSGPYAPIRDIRSYSVTLGSDQRYLASATGAGTVAFNTDGRLITYSEPGPSRAMIYARNDDSRNWRAICVLPTGWPMSYCGN